MWLFPRKFCSPWASSKLGLGPQWCA